MRRFRGTTLPCLALLAIHPVVAIAQGDLPAPEPITTSQRPNERAYPEVVDLALATPITVVAPAGAALDPLFVNRLPGHPYRVTLVGSSDPSAVVTLRAEAATKSGGSTGCPDVAAAETEAYAARDESELAERVRGWAAPPPGNCVGMFTWLLLRVRTPTRVSRPLGTRPVSLRVERLDTTAAAATERSWDVTVTPTSPGRRWRAANETAWIAGEIGVEIGRASGHGYTPFAPAIGARFVWDPAAYVPGVRLVLGKPRGSKAEDGQALRTLLTPTTATLVSEDRRIGERLAQDPADAGAHADAALLQAALAMRDVAGRFTDLRPELNAMTAHLALAEALRDESPPPPTEQAARAALLTLTGRTADAVSAMKGWTPSAEDPLAGWRTALRIRSTRDWRTLKDPARASLLAQLSWFAAISDVVSTREALARLQAFKPSYAPDWGRVVLAHAYSVDEGNFFAPQALDAALAEVRDAAITLGSARVESPADVVAALESARLAPRRPMDVIGRAQWAGFFERHVLAALEADYVHLSKMLGLPREARALTDRARADFGRLHLFPLLDLKMQSGVAPARRPPTLEACPAVVALLQDAPERVDVDSWDTAERLCGSLGAPVTAGTPPQAAFWFADFLPPGTTYDVDTRLYASALQGLRRSDDRLAATLHALDPYEPRWIDWGGATPSGNPHDVRLEDYGPLLDYQPAFLDALIANARREKRDPGPLLRRRCDADPDTCFEWAETLAAAGRDAEAVAAYERALKSSRDAVGMSAHVGWIVDYYTKHGRAERGLDIAREAAGTGSAAGLTTYAALLESQGHVSDAERTLAEMGERYEEQRGALSAFYIRQRARPEYAEKARVALAEAFPGGLQHATLADFSGTPTSGLVITNETPQLMAIGLSRGDIVGAVNGYRVATDAQYVTARDLATTPAITLIARHGDRWVEVGGTFPSRRLGLFFQPYGIVPAVNQPLALGKHVTYWLELLVRPTRPEGAAGLDWDRAPGAVAATGLAGQPGARSALGDANVVVRRRAFQALQRRDGSTAAAVVGLLGDPDPILRGQVGQWLAGLGPAAAPAVPGLVAALGSRDPTVRFLAVQALHGIGRPAAAALPALRTAADELATMESAASAEIRAAMRKPYDDAIRAIQGP